MKFIYPAVFHKTASGSYEGYFPDLQNCYATGDTLDEALDNANEAAVEWISLELEEDFPELPNVSDPEDLTLKEDEFVRNISATIRFYDGWDE